MQQQFAAALLDPDAAIPEGLVDPMGRPSAKRFSVYRNNVASSLIRVMEAGFPAIRKLVGDAFFAAMAVEFVRRHPPRSQIMMLYGADFAKFLQEFPPVAHLGYLPDMARLEQAIRESYHAADRPAIAPDRLASLTEAGLLGARLEFAPSLRLVRSLWPVDAIWRANLQDGPSPQPAAEDVLVLRQGFDPLLHLLPRGGGAFMAVLVLGGTIDAALNAGGADVDLASIIALLFGQGAITGITE
jgi:hypothetical protein